MVKTCNKCHIEKPVSEFHKRAKSADGYYHQCKDCRNEKSRSDYVAVEHFQSNDTMRRTLGAQFISGAL